MTFKKNITAALVASGVLLCSTQVSATNLDTSFNIRLAIVAQCLVSTINDIDFGIVDIDTESQTKRTDIAVKCPDTTPYSISMMPSDKDTSGKGKLKGATKSELIDYQIYHDLAGTRAWGSEASNELVAVGSGNLQTYPVYVKVEADQFNKVPDHYSDVVAVRIVY